MRHVRMLGLCVVAVLAIAAVVTSSASALPEWGKCVAKTNGKYENSSCTTKAKGKTGKHEFEWEKAAAITHKKFAGAGGTGVLKTNLEVCRRGAQHINPFCGGEESEQTLPAEVECESEHNTGEAAGKDELKNVSVKFNGCKLFGSAPCSNSVNEEEIVVNPLKGNLGYISKGKKEVGVLLTPSAKKGEFAKFNCVDLVTIVGVGTGEKGLTPYYPGKGGNDGIISPITPIDEMSSAFTQVYTYEGEEAEVKNVPSKFEKKPLEVLEDYTLNAESPENRTAWSSAGGGDHQRQHT